MIATKKDLKEYIQADNAWLLPGGVKEKLIADFAQYPHRKIKKYLRYLRMQEYCINSANGNKVKSLLGLYYERRKNKLGMLLGIEIGPNCFGKGLNVYHLGSIITNPGIHVGEGCSLHGCNCIGNNGLTGTTPHIGNRVDIGYGAVIIGDVVIADDVKIGANAVVNRSFLEPGCTIAGVPAKVVKHREQNSSKES